jgi:hypothetical protein
LHPREASQRPKETDGIAGRPCRVGEGRDDLDGLPRHLDEPIPHEAKIVRPLEPLENAQRLGHGVRARRELVGETAGEGRKEMALDPSHSLECPQERLEEPSDRVDDCGRGGQDPIPRRRRLA